MLMMAMDFVLCFKVENLTDADCKAHPFGEKEEMSKKEPGLTFELWQ